MINAASHDAYDNGALVALYSRQTSPRYDQDFWQNRLSLQYTF